MDVMIGAVQEEIADLNRRLRKTVDEAEPASLDWRPAPETNSLAVLVMHTMGSEEYLVATALGKTVARDREAEFRTAGVDKATLLARLDEVDARVRAWLGELSPAILAEPRTFRNRPVTAAFLVIHAAAHLAEHVGHAQLTCQLWAQVRV